MKEETIKHLMAKYKEGASSLEDENYLVDNAKDNNLVLHNWLKEQKKHNKTPKHFNEHLWQSFEKKKKINTRRKRNYFIGAASILLFLGLFLVKATKPVELTHSEKQELLKEAYSLFEEKSTENQIIYQDDMVIIYKSK